MSDATSPVIVRPERPPDVAAVRHVHRAAFRTPSEARLVDLLRECGLAVVSLVAEAEGAVLGHVLFSPVRIEAADAPLGENEPSVEGDSGSDAASGLGLAPLAVLPERQRQGIGGALIRAGLDACRAAGGRWVVVLGEPDYYGRFGFHHARGFGLTNEYGADQEFMVQALVPGGLPAAGGLVRYREEFHQAGF